jgi:hypothetical protein
MALNVKKPNVRIVENININRILPVVVRNNFLKGDIIIKNKPAVALIKKRGYRVIFSQKLNIYNIIGQFLYKTTMQIKEITD